MCILTFLRPGAAPDVEALRGGAAANPHGHGYAVLTPERIIVGRGMDPEAVLGEFTEARSRHLDGPALFHSRLATHGTRAPDNCHPFAVGGDGRTVLAHNGILPDAVHPGPGDQRSDSRIFAEDFLPRSPFGSLDSWAGRDRLEAWLGGDKMVLLTLDPAYAHRAYIFNEQRGHWDLERARWYSNHSYRDFDSYYDAHGCYDCESCGEQAYLDDGPHCGYCGYCLDCRQRFPRCRCPELDGTDRYADLFDLEYT
ncbi:class II glutamine amidotransferase domain-containing protein [Nocardia puris]|uniref:hypothetical protein n=1 Tax=Nocardia puris TaxID=208602 RepID=UPI002E1E0F39